MAMVRQKIHYRIFTTNVNARFYDPCTEIDERKEDSLNTGLTILEVY